MCVRVRPPFLGHGSETTCGAAKRCRMVCSVRKFAPNAKKQEIESKELTVYYDMQCPFIYQRIDMIKQYCKTNDIPASFIQVKTLQEAKELPCVFNNWGVFYKGNFETVNLLDINSLERILKK